jgi:DNA-binding MarR family transcriptional regulator
LLYILLLPQFRTCVKIVPTGQYICCPQYFAIVEKFYSSTIPLNVFRGRDYKIVSIYKPHYSDLTYDVLLLLAQTSDVIYRSLEAELDEKDITLAQLRLLLVLSRKDRPLTPAELCRYLFRKSQTMTNMLNRLEERGYVEIMRDQKDKRLVMVHMTDKGQQLLNTHTQWISKAADEIVSCFSEDELQQFKEYLTRLHHWSFRLFGVELV